MKSVLLFFTILALPTTLSAQALGERLLAAQTGKWYIRALSQETPLAEGRVEALDSASVLLGTAKLELLNISALERRTSNDEGKIVGGLIGMLSFGYVGFLIAGLNDSVPRPNPAVRIVTYGLAGVLLGGLVGEAIRPTTRQWNRIWP